MTGEDVKYQLLAVCLILVGGVFESRQARAESGMDEAAAARQSIIQSVREDIQRRTRRTRDIGELSAEREKQKSLPPRVARQPSDKQ